MDSALLISVSPTSGVPIYRQLIDQVRSLIASKRLQPGEFLPSVRTLAQRLQVNPMTVSKAYSLLQRDGLVELAPGQGMRILPPSPVKIPLNQRRQALLPLLRQVAATAYQLNLTQQQVMDLLAPLLENFDRDSEANPG
ncbi:MAG: GntR family transcriptional regulator [Phycisphaerales bacterium]|nr:GntR family transcriptional regulator [Phycisphaerales bacterium]